MAFSFLVASFFFVFYGLFFFTQDIYKDSLIVVFAGIFVTGGFLLNFGQFVPSWEIGRASCRERVLMPV